MKSIIFLLHIVFASASILPETELETELEKRGIFSGIGRAIKAVGNNADTVVKAVGNNAGDVAGAVGAVGKKVKSGVDQAASATKAAGKKGAKKVIKGVDDAARSVAAKAVGRNKNPPPIINRNFRKGKLQVTDPMYDFEAAFFPSSIPWWMKEPLPEIV